MDLGCLAVLRWLLHREGLRLRDLPGMERRHLTSDLKRSLGNIAVLAAAGAASNALQRPFYEGALPPQITIVRVPCWAVAYGVLIWPALWVTTEELVYLGYALPRLEARLGSTRSATALVILCWGPVQHPLLPALPDRRYSAFRALTALPPIATQTMFYLWHGRRLLPLVVGHWAADVATGLTVMLQPHDEQ